MRALAVVRLMDEYPHPTGMLGAWREGIFLPVGLWAPGAQENSRWGLLIRSESLPDTPHLLLCLCSSHLRPVPPRWAHFWNRDDGFSDQDLGSEGRAGPGGAGGQRVGARFGAQPSVQPKALPLHLLRWGFGEPLWRFSPKIPSFSSKVGASDAVAGDQGLSCDKELCCVPERISEEQEGSQPAAWLCCLMSLCWMCHFPVPQPGTCQHSPTFSCSVALRSHTGPSSHNSRQQRAAAAPSLFTFLPVHSEAE